MFEELCQIQNFHIAATFEDINIRRHCFYTAPCSTRHGIFFSQSPADLMKPYVTNYIVTFLYLHRKLFFKDISTLET